jgi:CheY-like chemotaxis protein
VICGWLASRRLFRDNLLPYLPLLSHWPLIADFICEVTMTPATARAKAAPTILVIEDYTDTRELLSVLLRRRGYNVVEAEDGVEGLLKAGWLYPDLILLDLSLPEMDGVEVARRIHAQAKLSQVPIFAVSAYLTEAVKADVRAAGCVETFSKPFDADAVLEKIEETLTRS